MAPRLEIRELCKSYAGKPAVDRLSLAVDAGEVSCLLGPSGCGKSTTLRIVAGVEQEDAGEVLLDGASLRGVPPEKREIGLMFQDFALFPHLTVGSNVAYGLKDKRAGRSRVEDLLAKVELSHFIDKYPHELSGGEQQRVALARALAPRPRVMLMDEPFSGLDERLRDEVRDDTLAMLKEEGAAVLIVTHDPQEAMRMADEIVLMRDAGFVQRGAPQEIYDAPVDLETAAFFSDINVLEREVKDGAVAAPWGDVMAPGMPNGAKVMLAVRPQHLIAATEGARATVEKARFLGLHSTVTCRLESGELVTLLRAGAFQPKVEEVLMLSADPEACLIFPT